MKDDSLLDIDYFMKQMKLGSATFRSRSPSKKQSQNTRFAVSQHLRTVDVQQKQSSPAKGLKSRLEKFESEYGENSFRSSSRGQKSQTKEHRSNPNFNMAGSKVEHVEMPHIVPVITTSNNKNMKSLYLESETQQFKGNSNIKLNKKQKQKTHSSLLTDAVEKMPQQKQQTIHSRSHLQSNPLKNQTNKIDSKLFINQMLHLINTESTSINYRINEFSYRIRQQIQKQYERFKQIMIGFVEDFFMISKSAFVLSFEKKSVELNASFYVVQEELLEMSRKLETYNVSQRVSGNLAKIDHEFDEIQIQKEVEELVEKSMRLESKRPHVELNKESLANLEKAFKQLLAPRS